MNEDESNEGSEFIKSVIDSMIADEEFVKGLQPVIEFLKKQKTCHVCEKTDATDEMLLVDGLPTCKPCRTILSM